MWPRHCEHIPVLFVCSIPPSHSTTEQVSLKKVTTTAPLVSRQKLDTEETSKQKKLKLTEGTTLEVTGATD